MLLTRGAISLKPAVRLRRGACDLRNAGSMRISVHQPEEDGVLIENANSVRVRGKA